VEQAATTKYSLEASLGTGISSIFFLLLPHTRLLFLHHGLGSLTSSVFGSVVAGAFQITFRVKMHVNDVFLFFKNHLTAAHQNDPKHTNYIKF